jgi:biotin transport system substrate-specific component
MSDANNGVAARKRYSAPQTPVAAVILTAALIAAGPLPLSVGGVPVTFSVLVLTVIGVTLGPQWGLVPVAVYLLLGLVGVPVYSGFASGSAILFGSTGGYLFSYLFIVLLTGLFTRRFRNPVIRFAGVILGQLAYYLGGVAWAILLWKAIPVFALLSGVLSFLVPNLIQGVVGFVVGLALLRLLPRTKLGKE